MQSGAEHKGKEGASGTSSLRTIHNHGANGFSAEMLQRCLKQVSHCLSQEGVDGEIE